MGTPEPPKDQTSAADDKVEVDPPEESTESTDSSGGGEKPQSHWGG